MRMVDGKQTLAAPAHLALRGKKVFGRGFVCDFGVRRDVAQAIDVRRRFLTPADKPATFRGTRLARVRENLFDVCS